MPEHNQALAGDTLYSISFNHEWRQIVASALQFYFRHGDEGLALDNEDLLNNVLNDLYTAESLGTSMNYHIQSVQLGTSKTTTSTSFVAMADSGFLFTPSKANFVVRCQNASISNNTANEVEIQIRFNGLAGTQSANGISFSTTVRQIDTVAKFEGVSIGVEHQIELYWRVSGGTGSIGGNIDLVWEIEEYD